MTSSSSSARHACAAPYCAGALIAPQAYTPFGVPTDGAPEPFGFTGELHDAATGLVYLRARWYDPSSSTFTSVDPFDGYQRQPYSLHPYQYGYSSPLVWTDPSGEVVKCEYDFTRAIALPIGDRIVSDVSVPRAYVEVFYD